MAGYGPAQKHIRGSTPGTKRKKKMESPRASGGLKKYSPCEPWPAPNRSRDQPNGLIEISTETETYFGVVIIWKSAFSIIPLCVIVGPIEPPDRVGSADVGSSGDSKPPLPIGADQAVALR
jgi:hypothetical protein